MAPKTPLRLRSRSVRWHLVRRHRRRNPGDRLGDPAHQGARGGCTGCRRRTRSWCPPPAAGSGWNQTSTARAMKPRLAADAGTSSRVAGTAPAAPAPASRRRRRQNSTAEIRRPTMKPTPMTIGEASGVDSSMPPEYSSLRPSISITDRPKWTKRSRRVLDELDAASFLTKLPQRGDAHRAEHQPGPGLALLAGLDDLRGGDALGERQARPPPPASAAG